MECVHIVGVHLYLRGRMIVKLAVDLPLTAKLVSKAEQLELCYMLYHRSDVYVCVIRFAIKISY